MAEEIAYRIDVDSGSGGKSLKDLKNDFKEAQSELSGLQTGTKEYVKQLEKLGAIRDDIGDLNSEINAFNPEGKVKAFGSVIGGLSSGFQAATGAAALFGGESKDVEKALLKVQAVMAFTEGVKGIAGLGDSFKVLGNVIKANPLMLIATVIIGIGTALFALKDKIGVVGEAFDAVGKVIGFVTDKIKQFTDWIGISSFAIEKQNQSVIDNAKKTKDAVTSRYDSQIAAAQREHKETVYLEIEKSKAILSSNKIAIEALERRRKASGSLNEDELKQLQELQKSNTDAYKNISDSWAKHLDEVAAKDQKATEDYKKQREDRIKASGEQWLKEIAAKEKAEEESLRLDEVNSERATQEMAESQAAWESEIANKQFQEDERQRIEDEGLQQSKDRIEEEKKAKQESFEHTIEGTTAVLNATQALTDLGFAHQLRQAKGNAAAEAKIRKKQFQVNKAFGIANAVIDGVQAVQKALNNPYPLNIVLAAASGVMAAVNVAKIASSKFDESGGSAGGGGGGNGTAFGSLSGGEASAPSVASPQNGNTKLDESGNVIQKVKAPQPIVKAIVVETEITSVQKKVGGIETNAKI